MAELNFPPPVESPWNDPNGDAWVHDGDGWVRDYSRFIEAPSDGIQYGILNNVWNAIPVLEAPIDGTPYVRSSSGWKAPTAPPPTLHRQTGQVFHFAGVTPPSGAYECKAQEIGKDGRPELYAAIGDLWATTDGVAPPAPENFRLPPSYIQGGNPVFIRGRRNGVSVVGQHYNEKNADHTHSADHGHSGDLRDDGGHDHRVTYNINSSILVDQNAPESPHNSGVNADPKNTSVNTSRHTHNVTIDRRDMNTDNSGGSPCRPESIGYTLCIWQ